MKKITEISEIVPGTSSYIQWGAVIAGSVVALAVTSILVPFGNGIGLSFDPNTSEHRTNALIFGTAIWIFATQLISSIIGGYISGKAVTGKYRNTDHENEFRDGVHGLLSWATASIATGIGIGFMALLATLAPEPVAEHTVASQEIARHAGVVAGFTLAASSVVSAIAAWVTASIAGHHRDNNVDHSRHFSFRRR